MPLIEESFIKTEKSSFEKEDKVPLKGESQ